MTTVELSVLLISWNRYEETRRCLQALHETADPGLRYEVIAVDNGSTDGSVELLAADPRVHLIRNPRNVGFAAAVNQCYRASSGELVLLLNNDVRFHPGALTAMVAFLRERPDAAGVSPLYLNPDGTFQQHYVQLPSFAASLALFTMLRRVPGFRGALHRFQMRGQDFSRPRRLASGSCQLLRRSVLAPDRVFDESFPIYWNDAVLARQLDTAGHEVWLLPQAVVTHTRGATCRLLGPAVRFRHLLGGLVCFLRLTQPTYRLGIFRAVLLVNHVLRTILRRPTMLRLPDLLGALRGDVGPIPDGDTRDWLVVLGTAEPERVADDERVLLVRPGSGGPRWRLTVTRTGPARWTATLPTIVPGGRWLNLRVGAALLRRWLDGQAGARFLYVDDAYAAITGGLGEDVVVRTPAAVGELAHV